MTQPSETERLQLALEEYLELLERGETPDRGQIYARFPDLRQSLESHFDGLDALAEMLPSMNAAEPRVLPNGTRETTVSRLGDYQLIHQIGCGGMGVVYDAENTISNQRVAVKVLPLISAFDTNRIRRFELESQIVAMLDHPHIVPIVDVGTADGIRFYVMQLIDGQSLALFLQQPMLKACDQTWRDIALQASFVAGALHQAHGKGIIHRDVKPGNLLFDTEGKLWLTDFGLARIRRNQTLTNQGDVLGTFAYMSPEQRDGEEVDHRTDIYSLGVTLKAWMEATLRHSQLNPDHESLPSDLTAILQVATSPTPELRYQTAASLSVDLENFSRGEATQAQAILRRHRNRRRIQRYALIAGATVTAAILLLLLGWSIRHGQQQRQQLRSQAKLQSQQVADLKYAEDLQQAFAISKSRPDQTRDLLDRHLPVPGERDLRGAEWFLLDNLLEPPQQQVLGKHDGAANELTVLPDGRIASVGDDGKLKVWNLSEPQRNWSIDASKDPLLSVAVSPDGSRIATGSQTVKLWDVETHKLDFRLTWHESNVESIAFSPDGKTIATAARYEEVRVFDDAGKLINEIDSLARHESIDFTNDSKRLLIPNRKTSQSGAPLGLIQVWNRDLTELLHEYLPGNIDNGNYTLGKASHHGAFYLLAEQYDTRNISVNSATTGEKLFVLPCHLDQVKTIAISLDDLQVAAGFRDGSISVWNLPSMTAGELDVPSPPKRLFVHDGATSSVQFLDSNRVVSCGADGNVVLTELSRDEPFRSHRLHSPIVAPIATADHVAVMASRDVLWSFDENLDVIAQVNLPNVTSLSLSRDGRTVAVAINARVETRHTDSGVLVSSNTFDTTVRDIKFNSNDHQLVVLTSDGLLHFADAGSLVVESRLSLRPSSDFPGATMAFSPNGSFLVCALAENGLFIVDIKQRRVIRFQATAHLIDSIVFIDAGTKLATGHLDSTIRLWNIPDLTEYGQLLGHEAGGVQSIAVSPTFTTLASAGRDGTIRLWSLRTGSHLGIVDRIARRPLEGGTFRNVGFSRERLITTNNHPPQCISYRLEKKERN